MKVKELISILASHPNQDADIVIRFGSSDHEEDDVVGDYVEVWNQDDFSESYIEIFASNNYNK